MEAPGCTHGNSRSHGSARRRFRRLLVCARVRRRGGEPHTAPARKGPERRASLRPLTRPRRQRVPRLRRRLAADNRWTPSGRARSMPARRSTTKSPISSGANATDNSRIPSVTAGTSRNIYETSPPARSPPPPHACSAQADGATPSLPDGHEPRRCGAVPVIVARLEEGAVIGASEGVATAST